MMVAAAPPIIFASSEVGDRIATRVRVREGAYAGRRGIIVKVYHPGAIAVRLTYGGADITVHFGTCELEVQS